MENFQGKANICLFPKTEKNLGIPLHAEGRYLVDPLNVNGEFYDIVFNLSEIGPLNPGQLYENVSARFLHPEGKKGLVKLDAKYKLLYGRKAIGEIQITQLNFD